MTDILADLAGYEGRPGIKSCVITRLRESDPSLVEQWERALGTSYQHAAVARWFRDHGHPEITEDQVARHRKGECRLCPTS